MLTGADEELTGPNLVASLFLHSFLLLHRLGRRASTLLLGAARCRFGLFVLLTASGVDVLGFAQVNLALELQRKHKLDFNRIRQLLWALASIARFYQFPLRSDPVLLDFLALLFVLLVTLNQRLHGAVGGGDRQGRHRQVRGGIPATLEGTAAATVTWMKV